MSKIITVSREFGSGGRELGKRLADYMNIPCYDKEIIEGTAKLRGVDKEHIERITQADIREVYPSTIGRQFMSVSSMSRESVNILISQQKVIKKLAEQGDCVFVGRCADIMLSYLRPFNIFVYADLEAKIERCMKREDNVDSPKEIIRLMKQIDKNRSSSRKLLSDTKWGEKEAYHMCINTSGCNIQSLIPSLAEYINLWFEGRNV